ncbi:Cytochrome c-552 [BD1-7 clade bacterium]|uniref:Cytochrome c-552 n=1 Tax=BD1-7 clade bacterium TaxID=2029982 RepID=A0A5S9QHL1_9GAMM|nr:Cytochrome c-552 [BD1-7 clade bacterium]
MCRVMFSTMFRAETRAEASVVKRTVIRRSILCLLFVGMITAVSVNAEFGPHAESASSRQLSPQINYALHCLGCHGAEGRGVPSAGIPDFLNTVGAFSIIEPGRIYLLHVPGVIGAGLSNAELAAVLNMIMREWAGASMPKPYRPFTADEVKRLRQVAVNDVVAYRRQVVRALQSRGITVADYPWP